MPCDTTWNIVARTGDRENSVYKAIDQVKRLFYCSCYQRNRFGKNTHKTRQPDQCRQYVFQDPAQKVPWDLLNFNFKSVRFFLIRFHHKVPCNCTACTCPPSRRPWTRFYTHVSYYTLTHPFPHTVLSMYVFE